MFRELFSKYCLPESLSKSFFLTCLGFFPAACLLPKCEHKGEAEDLVSFVHGGGVGFFGVGWFVCLF